MLVVATPAMASSLRSSEHLFQSYRWKEGRPVFSRAHLDMDDLTVTISPEDTANAVFSCRLSGKLHGQDYIEEVRDIDCRLKKNDGVWRIEKLDITEVLER